MLGGLGPFSSKDGGDNQGEKVLSTDVQMMLVDYSQGASADARAAALALEPSCSRAKKALGLKALWP